MQILPRFSTVSLGQKTALPFIEGIVMRFRGSPSLERFLVSVSATHLAVSNPSNFATRYPEASHANCKVFRYGFREAGVPNTRDFCVLGWEAE